MTNKAPWASPDEGYFSFWDQPLTIDVANGVLTNDADMDDNHADLVATLVTDAGYGSVSLNADGSFTYTPDGTFLGIDSFSYEVSDGKPGGVAMSFATIDLAKVEIQREGPWSDPFNLTYEDAEEHNDAWVGESVKVQATIIGAEVVPPLQYAWCRKDTRMIRLQKTLLIFRSGLGTAPK